jgi:CheY-like chemotaxis protein
MNQTTTAYSSPASRKSRQVLLVEDEAPIRELVRLHLSLAGFDITEIGDGKRALELARATRFDLIVLDLMLPGIDGITLWRSLRSGGANERSPILMLTAKDTESTRCWSRDAPTTTSQAVRDARAHRQNRRGSPSQRTRDKLTMLRRHTTSRAGT